MGSRQTTVPLGRGFIACAFVALWALALATSASAQFGTGLDWCVNDRGPDCVSPWLIILPECSDLPYDAGFFSFIGRAAWFPLQNVGPITVAVNTMSLPQTRFPLYVEIVPLANPYDYPGVCRDLPGYVVLIVYGHMVNQCGAWDEVGPIDITNFVPLGSLYAVRLYFPGHPWIGLSPAIHCFRVTTHPGERVPLTPNTWGRVKQLFR